MSHAVNLLRRLRKDEERACTGQGTVKARGECGGGS
jgi:hypothetical protein